MRAILLLLILFNACSSEKATCVTDRGGSEASSFSGTVIASSEMNPEEVRVTIQIDLVLNDANGLLQSRPRHVDAYLPDPSCLKEVPIGKQETWAGNYERVGKNLKFVVRMLRSDMTKYGGEGGGGGAEDPCSTKVCHPGAVCETWNDAILANLAVCTCLSLSDLNARGKCQGSTGEVCASNGNLYFSACHMLHAACLQQTTLEVVSWTAVNPKDCQQQADLAALVNKRSRAKLSSEFQPSPSNYLPRNPPEQTNSAEQPQQDAVLKVSPFQKQLPGARQEEVDCTSTCSLTAVQPVCASDGITYLNSCLLRLRACLLSKKDPMAGNIRTQYWGYCPTKAPDIEPIFCDFANYCQHGASCGPLSSLEESAKIGHPTTMSRHRPRQDTICTCDHIQCSTSWHRQSVCGDDGVTYAGECFLKQAACLQQTPKRKLHDGPCKVNVQGFNLCLEQGCNWPGEQCRVDIQGRKVCVCVEDCPAIVIPVCGSDGITYDSICHLLRSACLKKKHIWVVYAGQCSVTNNECERNGLICKGFEICSRGTPPPANRNTALNYAPPTPQCSCPFCPEEALGGKVCGSDGLTQRSECHLRAAACKSGRFHLKVRQRGACDACLNKRCRFYSICQTDEAGNAFCACPTNCLMVNKPVCGSDGRTYNNECLLKVHACAVEKEITVVDSQQCASCPPPGCPLGKHCVGGECVCRESCPRPGMGGSVCGTDGRLYPSACELSRLACLNQVTVRVDSSGIGCRQTLPDSSSSTMVDFQADFVSDNGCGCNKIGSRDRFCDPKGRCRCHWGVEGTKCDRCAAGHWGISNGKPCVSCSCNRFGSIHVQLCDPYTGQCKCKPGLHGYQCDVCPNGETPTSQGCLETEVQVPKETHFEEPRQNTQETQKRFGGLHFTSMATALIVTGIPITPPFTLSLNFTPSTRFADGHVALLSGMNQHSFLMLTLAGGHVEISFVKDLKTGKRTHLVSKQVLEPRAHTISAIVTADEGLILRVTTSTDSSEIKGSSTGLIPKEHFAGLHNYGGGRLVLGCVPSKEFLTPNCGFVGCLHGVKVTFRGMDKKQHVRDFVVNGEASDLSWKRPPDGGSNHCTTGVSQNPSATEPVQLDGMIKCQVDRPCLNEGRCISATDGTFEKCICIPGWQGKHCQTEATIIPEFTGKGFIRLAGPSGPDALRKRKMKMEITFLQKAKEGILLAIPPSQTDSELIVIRMEADECIKVYLRLGRIRQFAGSHFYEWLIRRFGSRNRLAIAKVCSVTSSQWHNLTIEKTGLNLTVLLDQRPATSLRLFPQELPKLKRELRKALTSFDLSDSPVYLGGIPNDEIQRLEDSSPGKQFFVGAIQKVIINGAELVLAGPSARSKLSFGDPQLEYWENITQWQGPPCGDAYSTCEQDPDALKRICRPLGNAHECACSTPLMHMSIVRQLMTSKRGVDFSHNVDAQRAISAEAEVIACNAIVARVVYQSKDVQHDVPSIEGDSVKTFKKEPLTSTNHRMTKSHKSSDDAFQFSKSLHFSGSTVIKYTNLIGPMNSQDNVKMQLKTFSPDGLVLFLADGTENPEEFLALALSSGRAELYICLMGTVQSSVYSHGSSNLDRRKVLNLKSAPYVADGKWHIIQLLRNKGQAILIVDDQMVSGEILGSDGILNNDQEVWLGGSLTTVTALPWQYQRNFTGCVSLLSVNDVSVGILSQASMFYGPISNCFD